MFGFLFSLVFVSINSFGQTVKSSANSNTILINDSEPIDKIHYSDSTKQPIIYFTNPGINNGEITTKSKVFFLEGIVYSKDGSDITNFTINGEQAAYNENGLFRKNLFLNPGENKVITSVVTQLGRVKTDTVKIVLKQSVSNSYLLIIAIDNYTEWPNLSQPVVDASSLNRVLTRKYQFTQNNSFSLINDSANLENIHETFHKLAKKITPADDLLIFFMGHGFYDDALKQGYWVPQDARINKTVDYLSNSEILSFINAIDSRHTAVFSDACFSGAILQSGFRNLYTEDGILNYEKRKSRWVLTSGRIEKVEDKSLFMKNIIGYLEQNSKNKLLLTELFEHVATSVGANSEQMPQYGAVKYTGHEGGQFVFKIK